MYKLHEWRGRRCAIRSELLSIFSF